MTVSFVTDEHIARALIVGLRRAYAAIDIVRVQDVGLRTADDPTILQWAADQERLLITQDIRTMPGFAFQRVVEDLPASRSEPTCSRYQATVEAIPSRRPMRALHPMSRSFATSSSFCGVPSGLPVSHSVAPS